MVVAFVFLLGLIVGSFLNVCITRIPEGLSIVSPGSRCPHCHTPIKPYDNVPVLAWLWLSGKCRSCSAPISALYPAIELSTATLFVACFLKFGLSAELVKWLFFTGILIVLIVTDFRVRMLPDAVNWFGFGLGVALAFRIPPVDPFAVDLLHQLPFLASRPSLIGIGCALLGALAGSLLLWAAAALYKLVRGRDGMGMGDVKMMVMVGAFLGIRGTFLTLLIGTFLGTVVGLAVVGILYMDGDVKKIADRAATRKLGTLSTLRWALASRYQLPLGSFLGIGALLVMFFSDHIDSWFLLLAR